MQSMKVRAAFRHASIDWISDFDLIEIGVRVGSQPRVFFVTNDVGMVDDSCNDATTGRE